MYKILEEVSTSVPPYSWDCINLGSFFCDVLLFHQFSAVLSFLFKFPSSSSLCLFGIKSIFSYSDTSSPDHTEAACSLPFSFVLFLEAQTIFVLEHFN